MEEYNIYFNDNGDLVRYMMGNEGNKTLLCVGLNPSVASKKKTDQTVSRLKLWHNSYGYDGWVMYNIYPERGTEPEELPKIMNKKWHERNLKTLENYLSNYKGEKITILAAWGSLLDKTNYLKPCLKDIYKIAKNYEWKCLYTIADNHPKHFVGAKHRDELEVFDIEKYIRKI